MFLQSKLRIQLGKDPDQLEAILDEEKKGSVKK